MFDVQRHRRCERDIVRKLGLSDEERRDLLERLTGHRSTTEISPDQWRIYVAELQRLAGRPDVRFGRPHLKSQIANRKSQRRPRPYPLDGGCTAEQLAYIEDLRSQIAWEHEDGPEAGFRHFAARVLFHGGRDEVAARAWIEHNASLRSLRVGQASLLIRALHRERAACPAQPPRQEATA